MNEKEKSLKLAELMGWTLLKNSGESWVDELRDDYENEPVFLNPYSSGTYGLAQFAAILLKFPKVMLRFVTTTCDFQQGDYMEGLRTVMVHEDGSWTAKGIEEHRPTQANILDEILRMNGVEVKDE